MSLAVNTSEQFIKKKKKIPALPYSKDPQDEDRRFKKKKDKIGQRIIFLPLVVGMHGGRFAFICAHLQQHAVNGNVTFIRGLVCVWFSPHESIATRPRAATHATVKQPAHAVGPALALFISAIVCQHGFDLFVFFTLCFP